MFVTVLDLVMDNITSAKDKGRNTVFIRKTVLISGRDVTSVLEDEGYEVSFAEGFMKISW